MERKTQPAAGEVFCRHLDFVYRVALSAVRERAEAEEAVQDAFVRFAEGWAGFDRSRPVQPYLARVVLNAAAMRARAERRRTAHHARLLREGSMAQPEPVEAGERHAALSVALSALEAQQRIAVSLRHLQGLSLEETAEAMELPRSTASDLVRRGLEDLRRALTAAGFAALAAPAVAEGALAALPQPAAPAALKAALVKLAAAPAGAAAGAGAGIVKGGLIMKLGLGVAAVGLAAGATFLAVGGKSEEPAKPAEKPRKFTIPVTDPGAQWVRANGAELRQILRPPDAQPGSAVDVSWDDTFILGWGVGGELDGPQGLQMMTKGWTTRPSLLGGLSTGGRYTFLSYDRRTERIHGVTAGAAGLLDGPFDRARFYATDYVPRQSLNELPSPDGRYGYVVEYGRLRCLDFAEQRVSTLLPSAGYLAVDGQGKVYSVAQWAKEKELAVLDPAKGWKDPQIVKLQGNDADGEWFGAVSNSIAVDEVHGRLYACTSRKWALWYWDLKDGSFHGVIKRPSKDEPGRPGGIGGATPGPFKGTSFYGEGTLGWGPDDPAKRFLYMGQCDDNSYYRLDMEKEIVWALDLKTGRFIDSGGARRPDVFDPGMMRPIWLEDGSFAYGWVGKFVFYKRVK